MKCISDVLIQSIEENKKCNLKVINIGYCDLTDQHNEYLNSFKPQIINGIYFGRFTESN